MTMVWLKSREETIDHYRASAQDECRNFPDNWLRVTHLFREDVTPLEIRRLVRQHLTGEIRNPLQAGDILTVLENYWDELRHHPIPSRVPAVTDVLALMDEREGWTQDEAVAMLGGTP
jgi:hypothetical protein